MNALAEVQYPIDARWGTLLGQKKYTGAESLLKTGYEGMKPRENAIPPDGIARLSEALDHLIELYATIDKPNEAMKRLRKRACYPQKLALQPQKNEVLRVLFL